MMHYLQLLDNLNKVEERKYKKRQMKRKEVNNNITRGFRKVLQLSQRKQIRGGIRSINNL